jgi:tetratricopeptide (TPR) repeat protein
VDYLLTAVVRLARTTGGPARLQIVPELIKTSTGEATWQQTFDTELTDAFQVQSQIASRVATALGVALGADEQRALTQRLTENPAAWDLYLKGVALLASDPATFKVQAGYFDQAAALDTTFAAAWARLARSLVSLYGSGTPDPAVAARARAAAGRAVRLEPDSHLSQMAMMGVTSRIDADPARAEEFAVAALRLAPNDPEALLAAASIEAILGKFDQAQSHGERARQLDPRSLNATSFLRGLYLYRRSYAQALEVGNDAIALAPSDPQNIQGQAMIFLAQGDLEGARRVIASAPGALGQPALVAFLATYNDLYWVLTDQQQQVLLRLPPSAFFDDPAAWGSVFMQTLWLRGEKDRARAYADTAHRAFLEQLKGAPNDAQLHVLDGLALAYMGKKTEAIEEGERGVSLTPITRDARNGAYLQHQLVRIYLHIGEPEKALDRLEPLLAMPYYLSPGWLRIDPDFQSLKGNPRFDKLIGGS